MALENEDLGKSFYEMLTSSSGPTLIDFEDFTRNSLHVVTELTYTKEQEELPPGVGLYGRTAPSPAADEGSAKQPTEISEQPIIAETEVLNSNEELP